MNDYDVWFLRSRDNLIAHFKDNYLVAYKLAYEAWPIEEVRRFRDFCEGEFNRKEAQLG